MNTYKIKQAWKYGWPVGLVLFVVVELLPVFKTREFNPFNLAVGLIIWSLGALWFGFVYCKIKGK
ncbi:MAG: hypothetical protein V3V05_02455 [Pontiella sp.]